MSESVSEASVSSKEESEKSRTKYQNGAVQVKAIEKMVI